MNTMNTEQFDHKKYASELSKSSPREIIKLALEQFDSVAISFSGAEDVVLIDLAIKLDSNFGVFCLDTGRLHAETYRFIDRVREHYQIEIDVLFPEAKAVQQMVSNKGLYSFYLDGHHECCGIRKVLPLKNKLSQLDVWITGQRKDQSPDTRNDVPVIQLDKSFSSTEKSLFKFNPLANWSSAKVWDYIRTNDVPYNELHKKGFISIGCEPCTRPVLPGQHERQGRWWWEEATKKECGLHADNLEKK
jgi:phosphoadenosine phosphosulfate reductase